MNPTLPSTITNLCISGASISRCPWITWVDCLIELLDPVSVTNYSCKGAGNQYITRSAINSVQKTKNPTLLGVMFTNFDKYDMWVQDDVCQKLKGEKHLPRWIDGTPAADQGFWCTGSHFPLVKEIYQDNFFNLELTATQDLTQILGLVKYCSDLNIPTVIMFDSPVFDYTECQLNNWGKKNHIPELINISQSALVNPMFKSLLPYVVDTQGLIGFCIENNLPWHSDTYGPHPPSIAHFLYFQQKILPWVRSTYPEITIKDLSDTFESMIHLMTDKWKKNAF